MSDEKELSLNEMINQSQTDDEGQVIEYDFVTVAEWPDEEKPKVETQFRRRVPVDGSLVMLGNDELWLIPEIENLGMDIEINENRGLFGKLTISFSAQYKHHKQLRELFAKIIANQTVDEISMTWEDAYMLMYLALKVNYKIPNGEVNRLGLLRQEHVKDILAALSGACKKKESSPELDSPLPSMFGAGGG